MDSSRDYIELIKSTFHGPESVETPEKLKTFLDDSFQSSPDSYISLLNAIQNAIEAHNSITHAEHFEEIIHNFHSLSTQSQGLATEFNDLKNNERDLPAIYLSKKEQHHEETKKVDSNKEKELKEEIQNKISSFTPILIKVQDDLCSLNKSSINEISAFKNPPASVKFVLELICIMLHCPQSGVEKHSCIKRPNFLNEMMCYDKDNINQALYNKVQKKIKEHPNITEESIQKSSKACLGLYIWVVSMIKYYEFSKEINALKMQLESIGTEAKSHDEHKEEVKVQDKESKKTPHIYEVNSPELSRALAPIIDRENEIYVFVQGINKQISEIDLVREAIVYGLNT
ncbi:hypothetical protein SteCoe_14334 [Stentor coeruleus]|uniref:Dynein heavy chain coiled coil stalk domain-containing protein n=1 Tax=Stentor coeruleus TaxID=5963 RepID=A0A1R2C6A2_9CILI|nr:hypothetical protein SteCoe_14334 [Stentor coeruleus]